MSTLLLRLVGPMQSWGITSRFDHRDTGKEPSKSGVMGLLAAAMGIPREDWLSLEPLTHLEMGVRHDKPGVPKRDYQTAQKVEDEEAYDTAVTTRDYLADAAFLVAVSSGDGATIEKAYAAIDNPVWTLSLGRKSYVPSESIWMPDALRDEPLRDALLAWPWLGKGDPPKQILCSWESTDGTGALRMDQPLSSFVERRFGARFVRSEWVPFKPRASNVAA